MKQQLPIGWTDGNRLMYGMLAVVWTGPGAQSSERCHERSIMSYDITAAVYSVVTVQSEGLGTVEAYLYGWTEIVSSAQVSGRTPGSVVTHVLLRTEAGRTVHDYEHAREHIGNLCQRAQVYAENQIARFASGLIPGKVCGSLDEARERLIEVQSSDR